MLQSFARSTGLRMYASKPIARSGGKCWSNAVSFRAGTQPDGEVEARAVRQLEIADDELRLEAIDAPLRFEDAVHGEHAGTDQPERGHQQLARVRVILDDEDAAAEQALDRLRLRLGPHARSARRRLTAFSS